MLGKTGILLTKTSTTGWSNWVHGELWLFPDGILRVPIGWIKSILFVGYLSSFRTPYTHTIGVSEFETMIHRPHSLWIPSDFIDTAALNHTFGANELRISMQDGEKYQLLWIPHSEIYALLKSSLTDWIGDKLQVK